MDESPDSLFVPVQSSDVQQNRRQGLGKEDEYVDSLGRQVRLVRHVRLYADGVPGYMVADVLNAPTGVTFISIVEVKSGDAKLTDNQRLVLSKAVKTGRIYMVNAEKAAKLGIKPNITFEAQRIVPQVAIVGGNEKAIKDQFKDSGIPETSGGLLHIGPRRPGGGGGRAI